MSGVIVEPLLEVYDCENEILTECENGQKKYRLSGICLQTEITNRNGRRYPKQTVSGEINRYITECVEKNRAVGELDHPPQEGVQGSYKNASHKFTALIENGNDYLAEAVVLNTPNGKTVKGLMEEGIVMGMSSRAIGRTKVEGRVKVVQDSFRLFSAGDLVTDPSAPDAFMTNLMEGQEWVWQDEKLIVREKEIRAEVNNLSKYRKLDQSALLELFERITDLKVRRIK